jgi:hypothetical protein
MDPYLYTSSINRIAELIIERNLRIPDSIVDKFLKSGPSNISFYISLFLNLGNAVPKNIILNNIGNLYGLYEKLLTDFPDDQDIQHAILKHQPGMIKYIKNPSDDLVFDILRRMDFPDHILATMMANGYLPNEKVRNLVSYDEFENVKENSIRQISKNIRLQRDNIQGVILDGKKYKKLENDLANFINDKEKTNGLDDNTMKIINDTLQDYIRKYKVVINDLKTEIGLLRKYKDTIKKLEKI